MESKAKNVLLKIVSFVSFGFYLCGDGRNQHTEETTSDSVIGGAVGGVLGVCAVVELVVVVLVLKEKGIIWKESKNTYEDISPGRSQDEPYTTLAVASTSIHILFLVFLLYCQSSICQSPINTS
ncbi:uncharacterized protein LOC128206316 [Mya arenaria]|uniref:uncharacterized protein LOC128206316 n=1 Tax=Mya arenaria TaxID=6604 RepID=UPI0022E08A33|nr:uncharacterized protein LOC128206316 [Mya arenaria]